jgi:hypothetical protein
MSDAGINSRLGRILTNTEMRLSRALTGSRFAYADLTGDNTYADWGLRFLRGDGGQNTATYINHRGTGEFRIEAPSTTAVSFYTNATERVCVGADGVVRLSPQAAGLVGATQPAFCATYNGTTAGTLNNYIRFETAVFNYGGHYNTTNGLFTAPIAGRYFFRFHLLPNNPTTGATYVYILKNGLVTAGACAIVQHPANTWNTVNCNVIFDMAANDTAGVYLAALPAAIHTDATFCSFSGYLLI